MYSSKLLQFFAPSSDQVGMLRRLAAITATTWLTFAVYLFTARSPSVPPVAVEMPTWVPFWPVFTLPYLALLLVTWLLPVAIRDPLRFCACLLAFICAFLIVIPWWISAPTTLARPALPFGWWVGPYRWLATIDPPNNVTPCGHGIGPLIGAWFVGRDRPSWRWPLVGMLILGLPAISFVWQHRPVDILIGTAAAAIGILVAEALSHFARPSSAELSVPVALR